MNPLSPQPSSLRPARQIKRRKYSDHLLIEAKRLAQEVSVAYAVEQTGVPKSWVYKQLRATPQMLATQRVWKAKAKKPSAIDAILQLPAYKKAKGLAELWHANVGRNGISMRSCLERAADSVGIDKKVFVRAYRKEQFTNK
jgi:hypothetical protein